MKNEDGLIFVLAVLTILGFCGFALGYALGSSQLDPDQYPCIVSVVENGHAKCVAFKRAGEK